MATPRRYTLRRPPQFWYPPSADDQSLAPWLLTPLAMIYAGIGAIRSKLASPYRAHVPVICVGNLTVGGTGKTPIVIALIERLRSHGSRSFVLTRGYGGRRHGPIRVEPDRHGWRDVGDEALLLARHAPTIVARNRAAGARLAEDQGADVIVMDDGFQNPTLRKDLAFVVVDAELRFGNGRIVPAGPLREPIASGLARANALIIMHAGGNRAEWSPLETARDFPRPRLAAWLEPRQPATLGGKRVFAFAGIGNAQKFLRTLAELGLEVADSAAFPDHHGYTDKDWAWLVERSQALGASLVTTAKDGVRLTPKQRETAVVVEVTARFADDSMLDEILRGILGCAKLDAPVTGDEA